MTEAPAIPTAGPDWQAITERIACPLCDYELRGLTTPRCPECGYTFDWADLLDPKLRRHPYLFESHPEKNVRSFVRTIVRDLKPGRFWKSLRPEDTVSIKRLMLYWFICAVGAMLPVVVQVVVPVVKKAVGSSQIILDFAAWADAVGTTSAHFTFLTYQALLLAAFPLLVAATLQLYRQSMQAARILPRHALRCSIYCGDVIFWSGIWQACLAWGWDVDRWYWYEGPRIWYLVAGFALMFTVTTVRLRDAYRHYMKFSDATSTVICSQFIVLLALCIATSGSLFFYLFQVL